LYRLGRWEQAYAECDPPTATFNQIATVLEVQNKWDNLSRLVEKHRARVPNDARSDLWQAVAHFGRGEYEAVLPLVDAYLARETARERRDHRAFEVKFRSQVRLGRVEDARQTHAAEARFFPRLHAILILALMDGRDRDAEVLLAGFGESPGGPEFMARVLCRPGRGAAPPVGALVGLAGEVPAAELTGEPAGNDGGTLPAG
jgi:hypothetical protein